MSAAMLPKSRPQLSKGEACARLLAGGVNVETRVCLLGIRGYYRDTMGAPARNDRGIYDDAICVVTPEAYVTFNANVDPSVQRPGVASLRAGLWKYKVGIHGLSKPKARQYTALVQDAPVTVLRDPKIGGMNPFPDTGYFGINIHRGGYGTTSSLGCQTIHPDQWDAFIALVRAEIKRHDQITIPYLLVENP